MKLRDYLTEETKEKVDFINNGKVLQTTQVVRVTNQTIKHKDKISHGFFEDKNGHRYSYSSSKGK